MPINFLPLRRAFCIAFLTSAVLGIPAFAQVHKHSAAESGKVDFTIKCSTQAQAEFALGITLLHHMTYPQARQAFSRAASADPKCGMAYWGIAMSLFQPLWPTRPGPEALQQGWDLVQKAKEMPASNERERALILAAEAFFLEPASPDYWLRIHRWEKAMAEAHRSLPDDQEIGAFYALSHLAVSPADKISRENADRAAKILFTVYGRNPDHPGAMHYLVHANDVPGRERELLEITRKYDTAAPRNPHALHMPTHIYTRLGDWDAVIEGNARAAEAALEHPAGDRGQFVWDEFPHAIEYLVYAHLQKGADDKAAAEIKRLRETARLEPSFKTAFHLASTRSRYVLERKAWDEAIVVKLPDEITVDWAKFAWPEAVIRFTQGLGAARTRKSADAEKMISRLRELEAHTDKAGEKLFARSIQVMRLELEAWTAHFAGERDRSLSLMREAVAVETATPKHAVTPGPTIPAFELLGDLLMEQGQWAAALAAYKQSAELYPKRFNTLLGAARAADKSGDRADARVFYQELIGSAGTGTRKIALDEARTYLRKG